MGVVTIKITSKTNITSMYGTTLIWLIERRERRLSMMISKQSRESAMIHQPPPSAQTAGFGAMG